jgi:hypothetical protein
MLLVDLTDVVSRLDPLTRPDELFGDFLVVYPTSIFNAYVAEAVEPVVSVDEHDSTVRQISPTIKKPRRVAGPDTGGIKGRAPFEVIQRRC